MSRSWKGVLYPDKSTFKTQYAGEKEVVHWNPPVQHEDTFRPGLLVTYTPGCSGWAGRGETAYYPASFCIHVVTEVVEDAAGCLVLTYVRHDDVPCNLNKAREAYFHRRERRAKA